MNQKALNQIAASSSSGITSDSELFDKRTEKIIRMTAWRMVRSGKFQPYEQEDIEQDMRIIIWKQMPMHKPELSSRYTYTTTIVNNHALNMINKRLRDLKNQWDYPSPDNLPNETCDIPDSHVSTDDNDMSFGGKQRTARDRKDLGDAIAWFLETLLPADRIFCKAILTEGSLHAAAKSLNIPFATFHKRIRTRIREAAIRCGIGEFIGGKK